MGIVDWSSKYSVSVESIDNDHKQLFSLINQLFDAMTKGGGSKIITTLVDELHRYTVYHFNREEVYFRMTKYEKASEHINEHAFFIGKVKDFKTKVSSGDLTFSPDLLDFLRDWLITHITHTDKEYSEHFSKYGIR